MQNTACAGTQVPAPLLRIEGTIPARALFRPLRKHGSCAHERKKASFRFLRAPGSRAEPPRRVVPELRAWAPSRAAGRAILPRPACGPCPQELGNEEYRHTDAAEPEGKQRPLLLHAGEGSALPH